jgi:hypothetical protein
MCSGPSLRWSGLRQEDGCVRVRGSRLAHCTRVVLKQDSGRRGGGGGGRGGGRKSARHEWILRMSAGSCRDGCRGLCLLQGGRDGCGL